jgi:hypothetical protein
VAINAEEFFQVVQIWEFINTFKDYLQISPFRIEELYAGLVPSFSLTTGLPNY